MLAVLLAFGGGFMSRLFLAEPSPELLQVVQRYLLITAVPGFLSAVMNVYQQVLRGVNHPNQALIGGGMQLVSKILAVAAGAWLFHNLDIVWLGWPLSFVMGSIMPFLCCQRYLRTAQTAAADPE